MTWIEVKKDSDFPIENIPFGVFRAQTGTPRIGTIVGDMVLDLAVLHAFGFFNSILSPLIKEGEIKSMKQIFETSSLNNFISLGKPITCAVRKRIQELLNKENPELRDNPDVKAKALHKITKVQMLMPIEAGDYTDFYSSEQHAYNVGCMFRDPNNALLPNWKHIPVGYHGRASSIVVSGTDFHRPKGQMKPADATTPVFGPTNQLDFELEMAFIIGKETLLGESISTKDAESYIFGMVIFNDWSARDIQAWEYVPLGPFLGKNFCSSISPWVVTLEALEPFRIPGPKQDPKILPYLEYEGNKHFDLNLEVLINNTLVSKSNFKYLYWNMAQQLAHHTVNGCNVRVGDIMASGTISGPTPDSFGSMLELTWKGTKPIKLSDGSERKFLHDNDSVTMRAHGQNGNLRIGFGEVKGKILPAK